MSKTTPKRLRFAPTRRYDRRLRRILGVHARQVGEILWAWNLLQDALFGLFDAILNKDAAAVYNMSVSSAVWHSFQSDKAQREMLLNLARAVFSPKSTFYKRIKWVIDRTGEMSKHRNDVAHTPVKFAIFQDGLIVQTLDTLSGRSQAIERLEAVPISTLWRRLRGDLIALAGYAAMLRIHVLNPTRQMPSLHTPRLLAAPKRRRSAKKKYRRRGRKAPSPPLKSSRE